MSEVKAGTGEQKDTQEHHLHPPRERDRLSGAVWGFILVWAGIVLFAENLGVLASLRRATAVVSLFRFEAWSLIFVGAGIILLLAAVVRLTLPAFQRRVTGEVVLGIILLAIGLGTLLNWNVILPLLLIVIGALVLVRGLRGDR